MVNRHGNGLQEKPTAHQADRPYNSFIIIKDDNREQKQTHTPTGKTEKVKVKRLTPTWTGHKCIKVAGSRPTKVVCIAVLTGNRMG